MKTDVSLAGFFLAIKGPMGYKMGVCLRARDLQIECPQHLHHAVLATVVSVVRELDDEGRL